MNEVLLFLSFAVIYGGALLAYRTFGKIGLYAVSVMATVVANVEVMIVIDAFGLEQTLGNVLFGVTFLITDILSENEGKKDAEKKEGRIKSQLYLVYIDAEAVCRFNNEKLVGLGGNVGVKKE